jgi:general secretion pathway protein G
MGAAKVQIRNFIVALDSYRKDTGEFPSTEQGLAALTMNPGITTWRGPYLTMPVPSDPWGNVYVYRYRGEQVPEIVSFGPDGKEGGEGPNADISSLSLSNP